MIKIDPKSSLSDSKFGYTLIELLVVIAIIGFLVSAAIYSANRARIKSRDTKRMADINALAKALKVYYDENKKYPGNFNTWYTNNLCIGGGSPFFSTLGLGNYIKPLPEDPNNNNAGVLPYGCYWYAPRKFNAGNVNPQGFVLLFHPESFPITGPAARPYLEDMGCYNNGGGEQYYCIGENW